MPRRPRHHKVDPTTRNGAVPCADRICHLHLCGGGGGSGPCQRPWLYPCPWCHLPVPILYVTLDSQERDDRDSSLHPRHGADPPGPGRRAPRPRPGRRAAGARGLFIPCNQYVQGYIQITVIRLINVRASFWFCSLVVLHSALRRLANNSPGAPAACTWRPGRNSHSQDARSTRGRDRET